MKLGLQIPYFTWLGGPPELGSRLAEVVRTADDAGFSSIWVMDHFFQLPGLGEAELDMLEAYTALGFIAGHTSRARLGTMVTGVTYRHPAILVREVCPAMKPSVVYASSMSSSASPSPGSWKKWSMTQMELKPASSAVRTTSASREPSSGGPPGQVK